MTPDKIITAALAVGLVLLAGAVALVCALLAQYVDSDCAKGAEWPDQFWEDLQIKHAHSGHAESPSRINVENAVLEALCSSQRDQVMLNSRRALTKYQFPGEWRSLPLPGTGRHTYNPAMVGGKWLLMRDENVENLFGCECRYWAVRARWNGAAKAGTNLAMQPLEDPFHVRFLNHRGREMTSLVRRKASSSRPVVEDLRCVRGTGERMLMTGVLFLGMGKGVCQAMFELAEDGRSAQLVRRFHSPVRAKYEKNWLFVQRPDDGSFDILHSVFPTLRVYNTTETRGGPLVLVHSHFLAATREHLPPEWLAVMNNLKGSESPLRLSAIIPYSPDEWLLLTHVKYAHGRGYAYITFALYVSTTDYRPTRYMPCELLTEMGVGITFAIDGRVTKTAYEVLFGVSDRISGSKRYPRAEWDARLRPWVQ